MRVGKELPRIVGKLLNAEPDTVTFRIVFDDDRIHFLILFEFAAGVLDFFRP